MLVIPAKANHSSHLIMMLISRDMPINMVNDLPQFGLIAIKEGLPIAYGAIRQVEGNTGILDSYITHAKAAPEDRSHALDLITRKLVSIAYHANVKQLLAFSADPNTSNRAERHGFVSLPEYKFQVLPLSRTK